MLALIGGSFDPVHLGHLKTAEMLVSSGAVDALRFIPCGEHPFAKQLSASANDRLAMLEAGLSDIDHDGRISIDLRELQSQNVSYTVDTCRAIREECGSDKPIALVIGNDILSGLHRWANWKELFDLVHLLVVYRPEAELTDLKGSALLDYLFEHENVNQQVSSALRERYRSLETDNFAKAPAGFVCCKRLRDIAMSSTQIRESLKAFWSNYDDRVKEENGWPALVKTGLSDSVRSYIFENRLYR